jgi:hypothetical protein
MAFSLRSAAPIVALAVSAAGCGATHRASPPPPKLPHDLAAQLATLSDEVAAQLQGGHACAAFAVASQLDTQTTEAIDGGRVPVPLRQPLRTAADELVSRIDCKPQPPHEHGKGKDHDHHKHGGPD